MADIKLSALPAATPGSGDSVVGLQGGVASLLSVSGIVGITLPANASPLDTDQLMERTLAAPNSPKTLTIARLRNQVAAGAAAAATLALADTLLGAQSGAGVGATIQQVLDAYGLAANDATPADTDKLAVSQGSVAKTLAVSALRTQLDGGVAGGRTLNGGTASTDTLTLANNALPVAKLTGVTSATDYFQFTSSSTGGGETGPKLAVTGADATVDMLFDTRGATSRYAWRINGVTKMDLNSGAGSGAALRVTGDILTQINGGRLGSTNENLTVNNGGTRLDLNVGGASQLRVEASKIGFLGASATPAVAQTGGAATAGGTYTATEQAMLQAAYNCLRTFGLLT